MTKEKIKDLKILAIMMLLYIAAAFMILGAI